MGFDGLNEATKLLTKLLRGSNGCLLLANLSIPTKRGWQGILAEKMGFDERSLRAIMEYGVFAERERKIKLTLDATLIESGTISLFLYC